jgi:hypothetical protein
MQEYASRPVHSKPSGPPSAFHNIDGIRTRLTTLEKGVLLGQNMAGIVGQREGAVLSATTHQGVG